MSQLIDKLNRMSHAAPQPMGFGRAQKPATTTNLVLIVSVSPAQADRAADCVKGADAALWRAAAGSDITALLEKARAVPDIPRGYWLDGNNPQEIESIVKSEPDFVIFPASTPLGILPQNKPGKILQVEASLGDSLLRATNDLPVDALLVTGETAPVLTWQQLMLFRRFASAVDKPLLVTLPPKATDSELQALVEAGVAGVIIEAEASQTAVVREQIDKLSPPRRKRGQVEPFLPRLAPEPEPVPQEEEEDE